MDRDELMTLPADMVAVMLTGRLGYDVTAEDVERHRENMRAEQSRPARERSTRSDASSTA